MTVNSKFDLHCTRSRKILFSVSLLFTIALVSFCIFFVFSSSSSSVFGAYDNVVSTEVELRNVVNAATGSTVIALDGDIALTGSALIISANKDITLTSSNSENRFYRLIGANGVGTIFVEKSGVLRLDGIIVTHVSGEVGCGVEVWFGGMFIMSDGVICNNTDDHGAVFSCGSFSMFGGEISNNIGGGVYNNGYDFSMFGGEISNNIGGGVYNYNGKISLSGDGVICGNNAAGVGGGVYNLYGSFVMSGGVISNNTAGDKGGGVYNYFMFSTFSMFGGEISNNTAPLGGGVCTDYIFAMSGGIISGNTANTGGGVYVGNGDFSPSGGTISGNTANYGGDDVYYQR